MIDASPRYERAAQERPWAQVERNAKADMSGGFRMVIGDPARLNAVVEARIQVLQDVAAARAEDLRRSAAGAARA